MDEKWIFDVTEDEIDGLNGKWVQFAKEFVKGGHKTARIDCTDTNIASARSCISREMKKYGDVKIATVSKGGYLYVKRI